MLKKLTQYCTQYLDAHAHFSRARKDHICFHSFCFLFPLCRGLFVPGGHGVREIRTTMHQQKHEWQSTVYERLFRKCAWHISIRGQCKLFGVFAINMEMAGKAFINPGSVGFLKNAVRTVNIESHTCPPRKTDPKNIGEYLSQPGSQGLRAAMLAPEISPFNSSRSMWNMSVWHNTQG